MINDCRCGFPHPSSQSLTADSHQKQRVLWIALSLLGCFLVVEISISLWSHSVSLLADDGHLLLDVAALAVSLVATWLAHRPAIGRATFGHQRIEILAALLNGVGLLLIALWIGWEAIERLQAPEPLLGLPMLIGAIAGLTVNSVNIALLHHHSHQDLNLRGAMLHMVADAASAISVMFAAVAVYCWQWFWMDAVAGLGVALLTGWSAIPLIQESLDILLEYAPPGIEVMEVRAALLGFAGIEDIESLRLWRVNSHQVWLSAQLTVDSSLDSQDRDRLLLQLQTHLSQQCGIHESILQLRTHSLAIALERHPLLQPNLIATIQDIQQGDSGLQPTERP